MNVFVYSLITMLSKRYSMRVVNVEYHKPQQYVV